MSPVLHLRTPSPAELSEVLHAPSERAAPLSDRLVAALHGRLALAFAHSGGARHQIDAFAVERDGAPFASPFSWSARVARRVIGTAAARAAATDALLDVQSTAAAEIERLSDRAVRGLTRPGSLGSWLANEPQSVRDLCAVEAANWACGLLDLVGDDAARTLCVGVPDAWAEVPGVGVTLCGRRDVATATPRGAGRRSFLRLRDGIPGPRAIDGLVVDGLIDALAAPAEPVAARVIGAWPDAGVCLAVELDDEAIRRAARVTVGCATQLAVPVLQALSHPAAA